MKKQNLLINEIPAILFGKASKRLFLYVHGLGGNKVEDFSTRFGCTLTVIEGGEHWFHTLEELSIQRQWETESLKYLTVSDICTDQS